MVLETIYGVKILYYNNDNFYTDFGEKKFCEIIFRKEIDKDTIISIMEDIYLNLGKDKFTFEVLKKNESILSWNLWDNYIWTKISKSKFNNFIKNKEEFLIEYYD